MEIYDLERYGLHMRGPNGWIVELGEDGCFHRFGGNSWKTEGSVDIDVYDTPTLLLTLDLLDPRLSLLSTPRLGELPICSFINSNIWEKKQVFQISQDLHAVKLISVEHTSPTRYSGDDILITPIPEKRVKLKAMREEDYPINEEAYWSSCDQFIGGPSFIRVLGPPIWLQWVEKEVCACGVEMIYICSIGYENDKNPSGLISDAPFFRGEGALYFFLCKTCVKITVISQST